MGIKEKKSGRAGRLHFNVIDVIIILAVLAAIFSLLLRSGIVERLGIESRSEPVRVRFLVSGIDHTLGDFFGEGNEVFLEGMSADEPFGVLTDEKTIVPAVVYSTLSDGTVVKTESPDGLEIDLRGSVAADGVYNDDGYFMLNGITCLTPGMTLKIHTDRIKTDVLITEIIRIEE